MASPKIVRDALATQLRTISGLTVYPTWPNNPHPPFAVVEMAAAEHQQTLGRGDFTKWDLDIKVMVSLAPGYEQAQNSLDLYLATSSTGGIYGAIRADGTLGGVVGATFVPSISGYDQYEMGESLAYMGAIVRCECWSS